MNRGRRARARASTPSGVATVIRLSRCTWEPRRVRDRTGAGRGPSSSSSSTARATSRRSSAPTVCAASARRYRATAADLAIAAAAVPRRPVAGSVGTTRAARRARPCTTRRAADGTLRDFVVARLLAHACASGSAWSRSRPSASSVPRCSAGTGRGATRARRRPGAVRVPVRQRAADAGPGLGRLGRRAGCVLERDLHQQHPRRDRRVRGRDPARRRRAVRADLQRPHARGDRSGLAVGVGNGRPSSSRCSRTACSS